MQLELSFIVLSGITVGLVQMVKTVGLPSKYSPLVAILIGVGLSFLANLETHIGPVMSAFSGLLIGLSSVGLYSTGKNVVENIGS